MFKSGFVEHIAHVLISAGINKVYEEKIPDETRVAGIATVHKEINSNFNDDEVAVVCFTVQKSLKDGQNGYTIGGGMCGNIETLEGLSLLITQKVESLKQICKDEDGKDEVEEFDESITVTPSTIQ